MAAKSINLVTLFEKFQNFQEKFAGNKKGYIFAALFDQDFLGKGVKKTVL